MPNPFENENQYVDTQGATLDNAKKVDADEIHAGSVVDSAGNTALGSVVASGSVALSTGAATIDTGVSESETATFFVALGPDTDDSEVTVSIEASSGGNYTVHLEEVNTSVGNPTVEYDVIRVR